MTTRYNSSRNYRGVMLWSHLSLDSRPSLSLSPSIVTNAWRFLVGICWRIFLMQFYSMNHYHYIKTTQYSSYKQWIVIVDTNSTEEHQILLSSKLSFYILMKHRNNKKHIEIVLAWSNSCAWHPTMILHFSFIMWTQWKNMKQLDYWLKRRKKSC